MMDNLYLQSCLRYLAREVHEMALNHGFWDEERNTGEAIALIHSELSEALEGLRHGNPPSEHIPDFSAAEEELADVLIRVLDLCEGKRWDIAGAIFAKMKFNEGRARKHGKEF